MSILLKLFIIDFMLEIHHVVEHRDETEDEFFQKNSFINAIDIGETDEFFEGAYV